MNLIFKIILAAILLFSITPLKSQTLLKSNTWNKEVKNRLNKLITKFKNSESYAVFDFDDTLVAGDVLGSVFSFLSKNKEYSLDNLKNFSLIEPLKDESGADYFNRLCEISMDSLGPTDPASFCVSYIPRFFKGYSIKKLEEIAFKILENKMVDQKPVPYNEMKELIEVLKAAKIHPFIVSGSAPWITRVFAKEFFAIPPSDVYGNVTIIKDKENKIYSDKKLILSANYDAMKENLFITDEIDVPSVNFHGKTAIIRKYIEPQFRFKRPVFVAGNSSNDLDMLRYTDLKGCKLFLDRYDKDSVVAREFIKKLDEAKTPEKNCWLFQNTIHETSPGFNPVPWQGEKKTKN